MSEQRILPCPVPGSGESDAAATADIEAPRHIQLADAELTYFPSFYDSATSAALFDSLIAETPWRQDTLRFGGREVAVPRLQAWYGDRRYGYSGLQLAPLPWTPALTAMRERITERCGLEFNSVLIK